MPCSDSEECSYSPYDKISATEDHDGHDHSSEMCSPFCTCACCATNILPQNIISFQLTEPVGFALNSHGYSIPVHSEASVSIWQPPKIS